LHDKVGKVGRGIRVLLDELEREQVMENGTKGSIRKKRSREDWEVGNDVYGTDDDVDDESESEDESGDEPKGGSDTISISSSSDFEYYVAIGGEA
jgi:phosphopantothenoylcysteine synthetase/decarboxylase